METWLLEFIRGLTTGHWKKDENIFVAQMHQIRVVYIPLFAGEAEVVIRCLDPSTGRYPAISPFYKVNPKDWTWVKREAAQHDIIAASYPTLYVVLGPSASGKTTYIEEHLAHLPVVSPDLWGDPKPGERWWAGGNDIHSTYIGKAWEWAWWQFSARLQSGRDFVFEAPLPTKISRRHIIHIAKGFGYKVICVYHAECLQTLLQRNTMRSPNVPSEVIARAFLADEEPEFAEGWDEIILANATEHGDIVAEKEQ
jgi:predicted kinase